MTERLDQILFAEFLNQCGCDTGVDTEKLLKEFNLEDIDLTTEKRFEDFDLLFLDGFIRDNLTNDVLDSETMVVNLLNNLSDENKRLKYEVTRWQIILNDYKQTVAKTLREQYHWLKNEDKILNHDKTVALLELESISARLGIDLI